MIVYYRKSRIVLAIGLILTAVLAAMIGIRRANGAMWVLCIALILVAALGTTVSLLTARIIAGSENQKILSLLYVELDPQKFVNEYAQVPGRMRPCTAERVMCAAYLAEGLSSAGRYDEALSALEPADRVPASRQLALACLNAYTKSRILLQKRDFAAALQAIKEYRTLLKRVRAENPQLANNMTPGYGALERWLNSALGKDVDETQLNADISAEPVLLRRMDLEAVRAGILLESGRFKEAEEACLKILGKCEKLSLTPVVRSILTQAQNRECRY